MKVIATILSAVLLFFLSACGSSSGSSPKGSTSQNNSQIDKTNKNVDNNVKANNSTGNSTQSSDTNENSSETFYGTWTIKQVVASGSVGSYSSDDIKALTGKQLTFSKGSATCFGDSIEDLNNTVSNPVYKKTTVSKDDFNNNYGVSFELLGVKENSITEVDATNTEGTCAVFFTTADNNKLLLYGGGNFFELDRTN